MKKTLFTVMLGLIVSLGSCAQTPTQTADDTASTSETPDSLEAGK